MPIGLLIATSALIAVLAFALARWTTARSGWAAAGPFLLISMTPFVPNYSVALGFSLDDVLPVVGTLMLLPLVPWRRLREVRWVPRLGARVAFVGIAIVIVAGLISAVGNAGTPSDALRLAIRGSGRMAFLLTIVAAVAILGSTPRSRLFAARAIAFVGIAESIFGLAAYWIGFPSQAGLEGTGHGSVLEGHVPGRISGTIGISPNFTGAILLISILITAGLAAQAAGRRERFLGWASVVVQLAALALTFSRVSLALTVVALVVFVVLRSRPIILIPIVAVLGAIAMFTPMLSRFVRDVPDRLALWTSAFRLMIDHPLVGVGPGQMLAAVAADPARYRETDFGEAWSTAHNTVLLAGAEMGLLGAVGAAIINLGLAVIAVRVFFGAVRRPDGGLQTAAALALAGFLAQGMVNNLFTVGVTGVCAAFLIGSLLLEARLPADDVIAVEDPLAAGHEPLVAANQGRG